MVKAWFPEFGTLRRNDLVICFQVTGDVPFKETVRLGSLLAMR
jgi:hypothetical protein